MNKKGKLVIGSAEPLSHCSAIFALSIPFDSQDHLNKGSENWEKYMLVQKLTQRMFWGWIEFLSPCETEKLGYPWAGCVCTGSQKWAEMRLEGIFQHKAEIDAHGHLGCNLTSTSTAVSLWQVFPEIRCVEVV